MHSKSFRYVPTSSVQSSIDTCEFYFRYHLQIWTEKGNHYKSNEAAEIKKNFVFDKVLEWGSDNDKN